MARNRQESGVVSVHEIPANVIGAVVLAELAQVETDGQTHPDPDARGRIERAVKRLREIATNTMSGDTQAELIKRTREQFLTQ